MSNNTNLFFLSCSGNDLTSLDVSSNDLLENIICSNNLLTSLSLPNSSPFINNLDCSNNTLTSIDVSNLYLSNLDCSNNALTNLNVANGANFDILNFNATSNVDLDCIQIDQGFTPPGTWLKDASAVYNGDCDNLSTDEFFTETISVYPNAVQNELYIKSTQPVQSVEIFNLVGQQVLESNASILNISNLAEGLYLVKVFKDGKESIYKILKK